MRDPERHEETIEDNDRRDHAYDQALERRRYAPDPSDVAQRRRRCACTTGLCDGCGHELPRDTGTYCPRCGEKR